MSLAIRVPNWIGDGVMALPALRALRRALPGEEIVLVALDYLADLYGSAPDIARVLSIPRPSSFPTFLESARRIRSAGCRQGLLLPNSLSSALLFRSAGIAELTGTARDGRTFLLAHPVRFPASGGPFFHHYLHLAEALAGTPLTPHEDDDRLTVPAVEATTADSLLAGAGVAADAPLLGVAPGAAFGSAKAWPAARFRQLLSETARRHPGLRILVFGSSGERPANAALTAGVPGGIDFTGKLPLRTSIALISRCHVFLANDSGLAHVASSLRVPLVTLFGPTDPAATAPRSRRQELLHHPTDCAPCRHRTCPSDHRCMTAITVAEVAEAIDRMLVGSR